MDDGSKACWLCEGGCGMSAASIVCVCASCSQPATETDVTCLCGGLCVLEPLRCEGAYALRFVPIRRLLSACACAAIYWMNSFSDFRGLWAGLSRRYPRLQATPFPPPAEGSSFLGRFGREVEEDRQQQLNTVLEILVSWVPMSVYTFDSSFFVTLVLAVRSWVSAFTAGHMSYSPEHGCLPCPRAFFVLVLQIRCRCRCRCRPDRTCTKEVFLVATPRGPSLGRYIPDRCFVFLHLLKNWNWSPQPDLMPASSETGPYSEPQCVHAGKLLHPRNVRRPERVSYPIYMETCTRNRGSHTLAAKARALRAEPPDEHLPQRYATHVPALSYLSWSSTRALKSWLGS